MFWRQIALRASGRHCLLRAHHDCVGEAAEQHDKGQQNVHHADTLMIDGCDPLAPQIRHVSLERDPSKHGNDGQNHQSRREHHDRLVKRDRAPAELAKEIHFSVLCGAW
jgi:hypothetical protein